MNSVVPPYSYGDFTQSLIYVPDESVEDYKITPYEWANLASQIRSMSDLPV